MILFGSFAIFCLVLGGTVGGWRWYVSHAMTNRGTKVDLIQGTALLLPSGSRQEVNATNNTVLSAGDTIRTTADSEALLSLFDGSNVRMWPSTAIRVLRVAISTYAPRDTELKILQSSGHARYEVAMPVTLSRQFDVETPQATIILREGSYKVQVRTGATVVTVTSGSATVTGNHHSVEVLGGEWVTVHDQKAPTNPVSDIHNLLANGNFSKGLTDWQPGNRGVEDNIPGHVKILEQSHRWFVEFSRSGSQKHAETFIHATVNKDVTDYGMLQLKLQLRILRQTLSGGGDLGSEYPIIVRVHYRDSSGSEADWMRGFYIQNKNHLPTPNAEKVIRNQWMDESFNLFDANTVSPRPSEILWIEISASGHGYTSDVASVQLLAD